MNKMEKWHDEGLIEIVKTDVMDTELMRARSQKFKKRALAKSRRYREDLGVGVWDHSRYGHSLWGGKEMNYPLKEIRDLLFPQFENLHEDEKRRALRDSMHLATHRMRKRDFFVTEEKNFRDKRDDLKKHFDVIILTPKECVEKLEPLIFE